MATYKAACISANLAALAAGPEKYEGKCVQLTDRVLDSAGADDLFLAILANEDISYGLTVQTSGVRNLPSLSRDEEVIVWGVFQSDPSPVVVAKYVELSPTQARVATATEKARQARETLQANPLTADKKSGTYLIGLSIAPGRWKGDPGDLSGDCYWEIDRENGTIYDNHFGSCFSIISVPDWAYVVEIDGGVYTYLGQ